MNGDSVGVVESCECGRPKEAGHDVCTPCAWELGWAEVRLVAPAGPTQAEVEPVAWRGPEEGQ